MLEQIWIRFLDEQAARRPVMTARDVYKLLYQSLRGPEHLLTDVARFRERLAEELKSAGQQTGEPLVEPLDPHGRVVRVNLRPYRAWGGGSEALVQACLRSAAGKWLESGAFGEAWEEVGGWMEKEELRVARDEGFERMVRENGYPAVHHSEVYRAAYRSMYRVVRGEEVEGW